jgi:hypothetical protein
MLRLAVGRAHGPERRAQVVQAYRLPRRRALEQLGARDARGSKVPDLVLCSSIGVTLQMPRSTYQSATTMRSRAAQARMHVRCAGADSRCSPVEARRWAMATLARPFSWPGRPWPITDRSVLAAERVLPGSGAGMQPAMAVLVAVLAPAYAPRRPTETVLYGLVRQHLESFVAHARGCGRA